MNELDRIENEIYNNLVQNIPLELQEKPNWVLYRLEMIEGRKKPSKIPYSTKIDPFTGEYLKAKSNDPDTWDSLRNVLEVLKDTNADPRIQHKFKGIGYVFNKEDTVTGIDIDNCIINGKLNEQAQDILKHTNSYAEISPSGNGIHIFCRGSVPRDKNGKYRCRKGTVEMYDCERYFTVTGRVYGERYELKADQEGIEYVYYKYIADHQEQEEVNPDPVQNVFDSLELADPENEISDEQIIKTIEAGRAGSGNRAETVKQVWLGNWQGQKNRHGVPFPSVSEAVGSLNACLAFFLRETKNRKERLSRLFLLSPLCQKENYAEKWLRIKDSEATKAFQSVDKQYRKQQKKTAEILYPRRDKFDQKKILANDSENLQVLLDRLDIEPRLNGITHKIDFFRSGEKHALKSLDVYINRILVTARRTGLMTNKQSVLDNIKDIGEKNEYNPLAEFFASCHRKYPGATGEFDKLCKSLPLTYEEQETIEFSYQLLKKWLIQAVALSYSSVEKYLQPQSILVLAGKQGIGKSRFVADLIPVSELVKTGSSVDLSDKDSRIENTSFGLVEIAEFGSSLTKKSRDSFKAWVTCDRDVYRIPYDTTSNTYPRRTSYVATINDMTFLLDITGDRRFYVLPLKDINTELLNTVDRFKLWSEVYNWYLNGERYWLTKEENEKIININKQFRKLSDIEQLMEDYLMWESEKSTWIDYTASQLASRLGCAGKSNTVGKILAECARSGRIEKGRKKHGNGASLVYKLPRVNFID